MSRFNSFNLIFGNGNIHGTNKSDIIFGSFGDDHINSKDGDDIVLGLSGDDTIDGGLGNDLILGGSGDDIVQGGDGEDALYGGSGDDVVVGNKGDDVMLGGRGDDLLVWNNGDGSDLINGGKGYDTQQVNFDTDLVNTDLQNDDVAEFSVTDEGIQFARVELNSQTERGLFQLDIRNTEVQETNFGGGDDTAVITGDVLNEIELVLDGGDGIDTLDLKQASEAVKVNLAKGKLNDSTAENFENVVGTAFGDKIVGDREDNILSGLDGKDRLVGRGGDDIIAGNKGDDVMLGGRGDDRLVWNNGDGSDLMDGGTGHDVQQVNFDTDLVNTDLQNDDVAEFSVTNKGIEFARVELNGQTERGLFQLDIRKTEVQETNFGGGDDTAIINSGVLDEIRLDLDGGDGVDTLDFSQLDTNVSANLETGTIVDNVFFVGDLEGIDIPDGLIGTPVETSQAVDFENVIGTESDDIITGNASDNLLSGLGGNDNITGGAGDDELIGNKGNDVINGGSGDDKIVWNNGDGSDVFDGGDDDDLVQVNFDTDLVNDDLQKDDVAEFSTTDEGVQFARVELNDQTENGLFQLDIRNTETLETNFGGGDDTAVIKGDVLGDITLDLDGGDGVDTLDFSQASGPISVDLETGSIEIDNGAGQDGSAVNFENVTGTDSNDVIVGNDQNNVIRGGAGDDTLSGGAGADTFVFFEEDTGVDIILDFEFGVDQLEFLSSAPAVARAISMPSMTQVGDDVEMAFNDKVITFQDTLVTDFGADDFLF